MTFFLGHPLYKYCILTDLSRLAPFQFLLLSDPGNLGKQRTVEDYRDSDYERSWFGITSWEGIKSVTTNLGTILDRIECPLTSQTQSANPQSWDRKILGKTFYLFSFARKREERRLES